MLFPSTPDVGDHVAEETCKTDERKPAKSTMSSACPSVTQPLLRSGTNAALSPTSSSRSVCRLPRTAERLRHQRRRHQQHLPSRPRQRSRRLPRASSRMYFTSVSTYSKLTPRRTSASTSTLTSSTSQKTTRYVIQLQQLPPDHGSLWSFPGSIVRWSTIPSVLYADTTP